MSNPQPQPQLEYPYATRPAARLPDEHFGPTIPWPLNPTWFALIGVAAVFVAANLFLTPLIEVFDDDLPGAVLSFGNAGIVFAECFVLAAWLAWGGGSFLWRLAIHWTAALALGGVSLIGAMVTAGASGGDIRDVLEVVPFSLPLFSLAIQLPLWIARFYFGWRLVDRCSDAEPVRPLGTRDFMLGTVIVAVSLALARLAEGMDRNSDGWVAWAILAPSLAGISLVSVLPVAVWMLRMKSPAIGLICIPIQTMIAIVVTVTIIAMNEPRVRLEEVIIISIIVASFAAALTAAALAARAAGFRLAIGNAP